LIEVARELDGLDICSARGLVQPNAAGIHGVIKQPLRKIGTILIRVRVIEVARELDGLCFCITRSLVRPDAAETYSVTKESPREVGTILIRVEAGRELDRLGSSTTRGLMPMLLRRTA
jgi:hypothetical protein